MAKIGLIFTTVFLMVQLSLAARIIRDTSQTPTKAEGSGSNAFNFNEALANFSEGLQKAFSKENVDKFMNNLGETGERFKEFGQGLINKAQEAAAEIAHPSKHDKPST